MRLNNRTTGAQQRAVYNTNRARPPCTYCVRQAGHPVSPRLYRPCLSRALKPHPARTGDKAEGVKEDMKRHGGRVREAPLGPVRLQFAFSHTLSHPA